MIGTETFNQCYKQAYEQGKANGKKEALDEISDALSVLNDNELANEHFTNGIRTALHIAKYMKDKEKGCK